VQGQDAWITLGEGRLNIINVDVKVSYKVNAPTKVQKNDEVQYTAVIESASNVALSNVVAIDSQLGELGRIPTLEPGGKKTLTKYFRLQDTTESYVILRYKDPMAVRGEIEQRFPDAKVKVEVEKEKPVYSLEVTGSVDKPYITSEQDVTFTLRIKNTGNVSLKGVKCADWNGNVFYEIVRLLPGQETTARYRARVSPGQEYGITCSGLPEDGAGEIQASYTVRISKVGVVIERDFQPDKAAPGEAVTITYIVRNVGDVTLVDVSVDEPQLGNIASFGKLKPGEEKKFSVQKEMEREGIVSRPILNARDEIGGAPYRYDAEELVIPAQIPEMTASLAVDVEVDPPSLEKAGAVEVIVTLVNDGQVRLNNLQIFIRDLAKENDIPIGSALVLTPGEQQVFRLSYLEVEQTSTYVAVVTAKDEKGNDMEFTSRPFEIVVDMEGKDRWLGDGRATLLRAVLILIIFLIILTAGTLIYMVRDSLPFFNRRKSLRRRASGHN
jgi:hypothetical protein